MSRRHYVETDEQMLAALLDLWEAAGEWAEARRALPCDCDVGRVCLTCRMLEAVAAADRVDREIRREVTP